MNMNDVTFPNETIETKEGNAMNTITISINEYNKLIAAAVKFDILREMASKYDYHTDAEQAIYGFEDKPLEDAPKEAENDGISE